MLCVWWQVHVCVCVHVWFGVVSLMHVTLSEPVLCKSSNILAIITVRTSDPRAKARGTAVHIPRCRTIRCRECTQHGARARVRVRVRVRIGSLHIPLCLTVRWTIKQMEHAGEYRPPRPPHSIWYMTRISFLNSAKKGVYLKDFAGPRFHENRGILSIQTPRILRKGCSCR